MGKRSSIRVQAVGYGRLGYIPSSLSRPSEGPGSLSSSSSLLVGTLQTFNSPPEIQQALTTEFSLP